MLHSAVGLQFAKARLMRHHLPEAHGEALTKRREWFEKYNLPVYVAWWVQDDHLIEWKEGNAKPEHLHRHGPTAVAFNFARSFDSDGNACSPDREVVKAKAAMNAQVQASSLRCSR